MCFKVLRAYMAVCEAMCLKPSWIGLRRFKNYCLELKGAEENVRNKMDQNYN